ncbi:MAG TPA: hypothetical protein VFO91_20065, partial [Anaerolineales bacterium]|nr:hypothetical protein [Anaerolineales bacterium]
MAGRTTGSVSDPSFSPRSDPFALSMARKLRFRALVTRVTCAIFVLAACVPAPPVDDPVIARRASPTPSASPAAPSTEAGARPDTAPAPFTARLAVVSASARVLKPEGSATELGQAQSINLELNDGIEVVRPEGGQAQSYSLLHFPDVLNVELFGGTRVFLTGIRQGEGGSPEITLDLDDGHLFVHPNEERDTRVTVRVPYATIRTLTNGAEFDVCRDPLLTCVVVRRGVVEVVAQNRREIVKAGEASVVMRDQPPSPAICAPAPTFSVWEERYRHAAGAPALQEE